MGQLFLPPGLSTQDENMLLGQEFRSRVFTVELSCLATLARRRNYPVAVTASASARFCRFEIPASATRKFPRLGFTWSEYRHDPGDFCKPLLFKERFRSVLHQSLASLPTGNAASTWLCACLMELTGTMAGCHPTFWKRRPVHLCCKEALIKVSPVMRKRVSFMKPRNEDSSALSWKQAGSHPLKRALLMPSRGPFWSYGHPCFIRAARLWRC